MGSRKGFTLIEIMLVVVIIGVLAAMVVPKLAGRGEQARVTAAQTDIDANLATAVDLYELDNGKPPSTEQGLSALLTQPDNAPRWKGPYLKKMKIPKDPWGRDYMYVFPGKHNKDSYDLFSLGQDGEESADDVSNWENTQTKK